MQKYSKLQINETVSKIEACLPDKDVFDGLLFQQFHRTNISQNFKRKDLKRINVKKTNFHYCSFEAVAGTGSKFFKTFFNKCDFTGANFQDCYFDICKFANKTIIKGANFNNSIFIDCTFQNMVIRQSTFFDCRFENCKFVSCKICSDTTENSVLYNCHISKINLAHVNIEYIQIKNIFLNEVILPPYQVAYIIGAPVALKKSTEKIKINTDHGSISKKAYCDLYEDLSVYYFAHKEYFPLANLLIATSEYEEAFKYIQIGIQQACDYFDFRMIKHYCRLACHSGVFTSHQLKDLYNLITQLSYDNKWDINTLHSYMLHIGAIRELLLNSSKKDMQCVELVVKTNIEKDDLSSINELYNDINTILNKECSTQHIDSIELRHNSPYELYITCIDAIPQILAFLSAIYGVLAIGNKYVDLYKNAAETKRVCQENKLYKYQREQLQLDIQLKQLEIQQKQEELNKSKASPIFTVTGIEHNIKCSTLDTAKTIAPDLLHYKYTKQMEHS